MTDDRIYSQATVDDLGHDQWEVHVTAKPPYDRERTYTISAKDDNTAAFEGLQLFEDEMRILVDQGDGDD